MDNFVVAAVFEYAEDLRDLVLMSSETPLVEIILYFDLEVEIC